MADIAEGMKWGADYAEVATASLSYAAVFPTLVGVFLHQLQTG